jgi:hypothetical protein
MASVRRDVERALVAVRGGQIPQAGECTDVARIREIFTTTPIPQEVLENPSTRKKVRKERPTPVATPLNRVTTEPDSVFDFASLVDDL